MSMTEIILEQVHRTNPQMTKEKLLDELQKSRYSALCLALACGNEKKVKSL